MHLLKNEFINCLAYLCIIMRTLETVVSVNDLLLCKNKFVYCDTCFDKAIYLVFNGLQCCFSVHGKGLFGFDTNLDKPAPLSLTLLTSISSHSSYTLLNSVSQNENFFTDMNSTD